MMEISDKHSLTVVMTALYVAKWESDDGNAHVAELAGSPVLAKLYNVLIDEVVGLDADKPEILNKWERWRAIEQRPEQLERTRDRIRSLRQWASWSREQKRRMIGYLLSPFKASDATVEELLLL
jgi:hypothetical protein